MYITVCLFIFTMGGGASKTKTKAVQRVDRVIVVGGTIIYSAALPADGTLRDAREIIVADRDDPDDPLVGVPQEFRFVAESGGRTWTSEGRHNKPKPAM